MSGDEDENGAEVLTMVSGFTEDADDKPAPYLFDPRSATMVAGEDEHGEMWTWVSVTREWVRCTPEEVQSLMEKLNEAIKAREAWEAKTGRKALEPEINWLIVEGAARRCADKISEQLALAPVDRSVVVRAVFWTVAREAHNKFLSDADIEKHLAYAAQVAREQVEREKVGRHAVVNRTPILVDGRVVGESGTISYEDGPPEFEGCQWRDCLDDATEETLTGAQFCKKHLSEFWRLR